MLTTSGTEIFWRVSLKFELFFGNIAFPLWPVLNTKDIRVFVRILLKNVESIIDCWYAMRTWCFRNNCLQFACERCVDISTDGEIRRWLRSICTAYKMCCVGVLCSVAVQYLRNRLALVRAYSPTVGTEASFMAHMVNLVSFKLMLGAQKVVKKYS